jgi:hypothetical protein
MKPTLKLCLLLFTVGSSCGCAGAAGAAVDAASQTWTCPKEQIVAKPTTEPPPAEPPVEIAANAERKELWQRTRLHPKDHPVFIATGCGHTLRFVCAYQLHYLTDGTPSMQWDCMRMVEPVDGVVASSTEAKGSSADARDPPLKQGGAETNVLAVLDALAAQMDRQGNAAAAAEIRLKAHELGQGKDLAPDASGSPSPSFSREPASGSPPPVH